MALRLGAKAYTVEDSTIYEKKEEHSALVVMFNNPDMKSPELDPLYFSGKTAAAFADSLGPEAINFDYFVMKLDQVLHLLLFHLTTPLTLQLNAQYFSRYPLQVLMLIQVALYRLILTLGKILILLLQWHKQAQD